MAGHIQTAAKTSWCTPPEIYLPIAAFLNGIGLDPCSNPHSMVPAIKKFMVEKGDNGLAMDWYGKVYCNPPYGRGIKDWLNKGIGSPAATELIYLIPAAVGTKYWQETVFPYADGICFLKGRVKFQGATASAPMDCALVYFGPRGCDFHLDFSKLGTTIITASNRVRWEN